MYLNSEVCQWRANVDIAAALATAIAASTVQTRSTSIATTKSTASGVAAQATAIAASTPPTRYIGTARARTSASGAALRRTALAAYIRPRIDTRNSVGFVGTCRNQRMRYSARGASSSWRADFIFLTNPSEDSRRKEFSKIDRKSFFLR